MRYRVRFRNSTLYKSVRTDEPRIHLFNNILYLINQIRSRGQRNPIDTKITRGGWVLEFYFQEGILTIWACSFDHKKTQIGSRTQNQRTEPKTETKTDRQTEQSGGVERAKMLM